MHTKHDPGGTSSPVANIRGPGLRPSLIDVIALGVWVYSVGWGFLAKAVEESPETSWLRCLCETTPLDREFLGWKIHGREIFYVFLLFSPIQLAELMTQISHFHIKIMDLPPFNLIVGCQPRYEDFSHLKISENKLRGQNKFP